MESLHSQLSALQNHLAWVSTEPIDWKLYYQCFSWGICCFESYLLLRQYPNYRKVSPPPELAEYVNWETFRKSQSYGRDKARFSFIHGIYSQLRDSLIVHYGLYAWAWAIAGRTIGYLGYSSDYDILQSNVFVGVIMLISFISSLPFSVYSTFVVEERHGFNKMTPALFISDRVRGVLLSAAIGFPFLSAFLWVFKWAGDRFLPWLMSFMLVFQIVMIMIYPTFIQPFFNKLSPLPEGELRTKIEALASRLKFPLKYLYEIDGSKRSSHSNAYFFGLPWSKHVVIYDTLIKQSSVGEIEAVLAHELGHWYYSHPTKLMCISQLHIFAILAIFPAFLHSPPLLLAFDFPTSIASKPPTILAFLLFQNILVPTDAILGMAMNAISRRFEWQADAFACGLASKLGAHEMNDMGTRLGRALISLHNKNLSTFWVDWLYSAYHHSHPTLLERLCAIKALTVRNEKESSKEEKKEQ